MDKDYTHTHIKWNITHSQKESVQFSSVAQSCPTLCDPTDRSTPGLPVHHQLPEFTQTHAHWVSDAIQPSHPLSSPTPPTFNLSQHQGLFKWVSSLHQVAKLLEIQQTLNRIISEKSTSRSIIIKMLRTTKKKNFKVARGKHYITYREQWFKWLLRRNHGGQK